MESLHEFEEACQRMPWKRRRLADLKGICDEAVHRAAGRFSSAQSLVTHHRALRRKDDRRMVGHLAAALAAPQRVPTVAATSWTPSASQTLTKTQFIEGVRSLMGHLQSNVHQRRRSNSLARHMPLQLNLKARRTRAAAAVPHLLFSSAHTDRLPSLLLPFLQSTAAPLGVDVLVAPWLLQDRLIAWKQVGFTPEIISANALQCKRLPRSAHVRFVTTVQLVSSPFLLQDIVVCEDIQRWTSAQKRALADRRCRAVVVGGWSVSDGSSKSALSQLPYALDWSDTLVRKMVNVAVDLPPLVTHKPIATVAGRKACFPAGCHSDFVGKLVEHLVRVYIWTEKHVDLELRVGPLQARACWLALRDARQCALEQETDPRVLKAIALVVDWCTRLMTCDIALVCATATEFWGVLALVWGRDTPRVCPKCAVVSLDQPEHACAWAGQGVLVPEASDMRCYRLSSRLEDGYSSAECRTIFRRLLSARNVRLPYAMTQFYSELSTAIVQQTEWHAGMLTLRAWCSVSGPSPRPSSMCLDDAKGAAADAKRMLLQAERKPAVACSLAIMGAASFRQQQHRSCIRTATAASLPRGRAIARDGAEDVDAEAFEQLPPVPMPESLSLWLLIKHSERRESQHRLWTLAQHWERIFEILGTRWVIVGGPNLIDTWSFQREVRRVALLPSFFQCADAYQRCRRALTTWPHADVVCYAPENSPCLRAFQRMADSFPVLIQSGEPAE